MPDHGVSQNVFRPDGRLLQHRTRRARAGTAACFLLTGFLFATWASRIPAIRGELEITEGQLALAFMGLNAGAIVGLQVGALSVPRLGSRPVLTISLVTSYAVLLTPALAPTLPLLIASLFTLALANSVVDVSMNAQGVAVERRYGRPVLSSMHAMHSLGGIIGAGAGAMATGASLDPFLHFGMVTVLGGVASIAVSRLLLPSWVDADQGTSDGTSGSMTSLLELLRGWSRPMAFAGSLGFLHHPG